MPATWADVCGKLKEESSSDVSKDEILLKAYTAVHDYMKASLDARGRAARNIWVRISQESDTTKPTHLRENN